MEIGLALMLIAIGAILAFAVDATLAGIDIQTVGIILMVVGALGFVLGLMTEARPWRRRTTVVHDRPVVEERVRY